VFRLAVPAGLDEQFAAWLVEACRVGGLPCDPEKKSTVQFTRVRPSCGHPPGLPSERSLCRARPEMHDMICPCLTYLDMRQAIAELSDVAPGLADSDPALLTTRRGSARVVAGISPMMLAGPVWLPNGLGVTPGARRAASRGGAQPARLQRPPRLYRRHPRHKPVPARPGPLPAGGGA